jgi:glyoxylase-like metal-dependent hydrolase (beta-lactamase superfamily II)
MEIIVLLEGIHEDKGPKEGTWVVNSLDPICSSVTLLKDKDNILVDTGYRGFGEEILTCLNKQGLTSDEIDIVFNTHNHFDHCYNNYLFKNAKVIHGQNEFYPKKLDVFSSIAIPGVEIIKTPGHYPDHQSIIVRTDQTYIIAGDAFREDIIREEEKWNSMNDKYVKSAKLILSIANVIIPGHGRVIQGEILEELRTIIGLRESS